MTYEEVHVRTPKETLYMGLHPNNTDPFGSGSVVLLFNERFLQHVQRETLSSQVYERFETITVLRIENEHLICISPRVTRGKCTSTTGHSDYRKGYTWPKRDTGQDRNLSYDRNKEGKVRRLKLCKVEGISQWRLQAPPRLPSVTRIDRTRTKPPLQGRCQKSTSCYKYPS